MSKLGFLPVVKMGKRGEVGQIITSIPVLVMVVILMAIFVALSVSVFQLKKTAYSDFESEISSSADDYRFLLNDADGKALFDVVALAESAEDRDAARESLKAAFERDSKNGECLYVYSQKESNRFYLADYENMGEVRRINIDDENEKERFNKNYQDKGRILDLEVGRDGVDKTIGIYYGLCLEGENE